MSGKFFISQSHIIFINEISILLPDCRHSVSII
nr:MAG TPA: hypothetical protein [Caudoviricetes sp.]